METPGDRDPAHLRVRWAGFDVSLKGRGYLVLLALSVLAVGYIVLMGMR